MDDPQAMAGLVGLGGAAIVAALVEVTKRILCLEEGKWTRFLPAAALVLGLAWNWLIGPLVVEGGMEWRVIVVYGLFSGLAAIGVYGAAAKGTAGK